MKTLDMAMFEGLNVLAIKRTIVQKWQYGTGPETTEVVDVAVHTDFDLGEWRQRFASYGYNLTRWESRGFSNGWEITLAGFNQPS